MKANQHFEIQFCSEWNGKLLQRSFLLVLYFQLHRKTPSCPPIAAGPKIHHVGLYT